MPAPSAIRACDGMNGQAEREGAGVGQQGIKSSLQGINSYEPQVSGTVNLKRYLEQQTLRRRILRNAPATFSSERRLTVQMARSHGGLHDRR